MAEKQNNCFTDIRDGIEALYRIIENAGNRCDGEIINIGNPENEASIEELGEMLLASFENIRCAITSHRLRAFVLSKVAATMAKDIRT